ncbi:MAG: hypothetical protein KF805_02785 [Phycisphaeraceae bacterium]|nr:hypothetical protein [Phycisphaeraceae bacterium]
MKRFRCAAAVSVCFCAQSFGIWGVRYEVNTGSGWSSSIAIDVSSGPKTIDFRISVYHDGMQVSSNEYGVGSAWAPLRLCNSQKIQNFGLASLGDNLMDFKAAVGTANPNALVHAQSGSDLVLGTPNSLLSFAADSGYLLLNPRPQRFETIFYTGQVLVGNTGPAATSRTITFTANSFAYPNADQGTGGTYGASFATSPALAYGVALQAASPIPAVIVVGGAQPCPADFNGDGEVSDPDFAIFAAAYDIFDCSEPSMPAGCPSDLNHDNIVEDTDFAIFAAAYDALLCP